MGDPQGHAGPVDEYMQTLVILTSHGISDLKSFVSPERQDFLKSSRKYETVLPLFC